MPLAFRDAKPHRDTPRGVNGNARPSRLGKACFALSGALAAAVLMVTPAGASSGHLSVHRARDVAGRSPYAGRSCNIPTDGWVASGGVEAEPTLAVNPKNQRNVVAAWMDPTRSSIDTSFSTDGGKSWTQSRPKGVDSCGGNHSEPWEASGDVWLSFDHHGNVYLLTLAWAHFVTAPTSDYVSVVYVLRSHDGGRTWSRPALVSGARADSDKDMILADPRHPGTVYDVFDNAGFGVVAPPRGANKLIFAKSKDFGRHWHRTVIAHFSQKRSFANSQLNVLPDGTLVETAGGPNRAGQDTIQAWRSTDGGSTWHGPFAVAKLTDGHGPSYCGFSARGTGGDSSATALIGKRSLAIVINDGAAAAHGNGKLLLARSRDGGRTWHTRKVLSSKHELLLASVAGHLDGRVGIVYDAIKQGGASCGSSPVLPTQTRVVTSRNRGRTWSGGVVVGPRWFNQYDALVGSQYFLGDYQNIVPSSRGFTSVAVQGRAVQGHNVRGFKGKTGVVVAHETMR